MWQVGLDCLICGLEKLALTVLYVALTVLYMALTVLYVPYRSRAVRVNDGRSADPLFPFVSSLGCGRQLVFLFFVY